MHPQPQPKVVNPTGLPKPLISPHTALCSLVRAWLALRDRALLTWVSGTDPANPLETPTPDKADPILGQMRQIHTQALGFAQFEAEKGETAEEVLRAAIDEVLAGERPVFLLHSDNLPGSF